MIDINVIITGIYNKLNISSITNLVNGIFHLTVPQGTSFPYIRYQIIGGSNLDNFTKWGDRMLFQISVFSQNKNKAGNPVSGSHHCGVISKAVTDIMDEAEIAADDYNVYFCQRQGPPRTFYEEEVPVYHWLLEYRIEFERNK